MRARVMGAALIAVTLAGTGAALWAAIGSLAASPPRRGSSAASAAARSGSTADADSLLADAFRRPMFRPNRRPAAVRFDPAGAPDGAPADAPPPVARPQLSISGIVWGPEPAAIVEGLPGAEGSMVLRRGERSAGVRLARIERDRVVLTGMDTTWTLRVREPWR
jgi:hypothetical protein